MKCTNYLAILLLGILYERYYVKAQKSHIKMFWAIFSYLKVETTKISISHNELLYNNQNKQLTNIFTQSINMSWISVTILTERKIE
jgi:hypothetical protein